MLNRSVSKTDAPALFAEAKNCTLRYDYQGAAEILMRVRKLEPTNDKVLVELGSAYAKAYDFASAHRYFEEGIRISQTKAEAIIAVGHHWLEVRNFEVAKGYFDKLLQERQIPLGAFVRLIELLIRTRRLDDAMHMTQWALEIYKNNDVVWLARGRVHRQLKQYLEAEKLLRTISRKTENDTQVRAGAFYELGALFDEQGRYQEAMSCFVEAKTLMSLTAGPTLKILRSKQKSMRDMCEGVTEAMVQRWRKTGETDLQPPRKLALLGGHARSGTTLLEYIVDAHPEVVSAEETMVYHNVAYYPIGKGISPNTSFLSAIDWMSPRTLREIRANYFRGIESYLGEAIGDRLLMDKNPANTFDIPSLARVFPEMKFLIALRDPRDVCLSCFTQPVPIIPDTASWLTLEGTINHFTHIMGIWLAWRKVLGDAALEVRYEDVVDNLEPTARRTLDFLDLPWNERVLKFNEHASTKIVKSPTYAEVTKPIF
ncbi:MAG: Sulfotransferase, partial [Verrucomicrobiales bacterium]|nr:Sulfotransferase [Verrucomicrobiales bacterium]